VESAAVDFWSGVVIALYYDGSGGVVGMAGRRMETAWADTWIVFSTMAAQCGLDANLFWHASLRAGFRRNYHALDCACGDTAAVLAGE